MNTQEEQLHALRFRPSHRAKIFRSLSAKDRALASQHLSRHILRELFERLSDKELVRICEELDPDEVADVLRAVSARRQKQIVNGLSAHLGRSVDTLLMFAETTAAGLMSLDYIEIDQADTIATAVKHFKKHERRTGRFPAIFGMKAGRFGGYLPVHELAMKAPSRKIGPLLEPLPTVSASQSREDVIEIFRRHPHNKVVVLGEDQNVHGVIYSDDVLRLLRAKHASKLYAFAGVHEQETVSDGAMSKVRFRAKWLVLNLLTTLFAAFVVSLFEDTITAYVLLAVYMPVVAGMGGNAGTQTLAVLVRGIALNQIEWKNAWPIFKREVAAGLLNGLLNGVLIALVVLVVNRNVPIAIILACAMVINLFVAAFFGTLMPLILRALGKDPATSAGVFITTATDVFGFLAFLGLASLFLK